MLDYIQSGFLLTPALFSLTSFSALSSDLVPCLQLLENINIKTCSKVLKIVEIGAWPPVKITWVYLLHSAGNFSVVKLEQNRSCEADVLIKNLPAALWVASLIEWRMEESRTRSFAALQILHTKISWCITVTAAHLIPRDNMFRDRSDYGKFWRRWHGFSVQGIVKPWGLVCRMFAALFLHLWWRAWWGI